MYYTFEYLNTRQRKQVAEQFGDAPVTGNLFDVDPTTGQIVGRTAADIAIAMYVPQERAGVDEHGNPVIMPTINGSQADGVSRPGDPGFNFLALVAQKFAQMAKAIEAQADALETARKHLAELGEPMAFPRAALLADIALMGVTPGVVSAYGFDADERWNLSDALLCGSAASDLAGEEVRITLTDDLGAESAMKGVFGDDGVIRFGRPIISMNDSPDLFDEKRTVSARISHDEESTLLNGEEWEALREGGSLQNYLARLVERNLAAADAMNAQPGMKPGC